MELRCAELPVMQMLQKRHDSSVLTMASYSRKRLSEATEIFDTDVEADDTDEESARRSDELFGYDSSTTLSTPDLPTPDNSSLGVFDFRLEDKPVEGPTGPHLFRSSVASSLYARSTEIDLYLERSPVQTRFSSSALELPLHTVSSPPPKAFKSLAATVDTSDENNVRSWTPVQVASWMSEAGLDNDIIDKFIINDISGLVLLNLRVEDLKELDIQSFGKRHQVMSSIQSLRNSVSSQSDSNERREKRPRTSEPSVSPTGEVPHRSRGRRCQDDSVISPAESVSIVGIEQLLPKLHKCSKGESCSKYKKQQRRLARLAAEYPGEILQNGGSIITGNPGNPDTAQNMLRPTSDAEPSVVASSDVFGPSQQPKLCQEALSEVIPRDPQESIRQFLSYQHVGLPPLPTSKIIPEIITTPAAPVPFTQLSPTQSAHMAANLRSLPKLTIPADPESDLLTSAQRTITPSMGARQAATQRTLQEYGAAPFGYEHPFSPVNFYRQETPFSEMDVPVTAIPLGPIARETSQSVPPDMRYGNGYSVQQDPVVRAFSTRPPLANTLSRVDEADALTPIDAPSDLIKTPRHAHYAYSGSQSSVGTDPEVTRSGWMKKRKTTRFLRHEWHDAHFTLKGTNLAMHKDEVDSRHNSKALEVIDVDDFAVACSSLASSSKLTAAFKRSILRRAINARAGGEFMNSGSDNTAFAFSLIPSKDGEKRILFAPQGKSHHFSVKTRDERIDWMRELMLAKALKKGKQSGGELCINGMII